MTDRPHSELLKGQAYKLFLDELAQNIAFAKEVLGDSSSSKDISDLRIRFHSIKGASGFFGLTRIFNVSSRMEEILKDGAPTPAGRAELKQLVSNLSELSESLPIPT